MALTDFIRFESGSWYL